MEQENKELEGMDVAEVFAKIQQLLGATSLYLMIHLSYDPKTKKNELHIISTAVDKNDLFIEPTQNSLTG